MGLDLEALGVGRNNGMDGNVMKTFVSLLHGKLEKNGWDGFLDGIERERTGTGTRLTTLWNTNIPRLKAHSPSNDACRYCYIVHSVELILVHLNVARNRPSS